MCQFHISFSFRELAWRKPCFITRIGGSLTLFSDEISRVGKRVIVWLLSEQHSAVQKLCGHCRRPRLSGLVTDQ